MSVAENVKRAVGNQLKNPDAFIKYKSPYIINARDFHKTTIGINAGAKDRCSRPSSGVKESNAKDEAIAGKSKLNMLCEIQTITCSGEPSDDHGQPVDEILDVILPPIKWKENGQVWKQVVSSVPGTGLDLNRLETKLNGRLRERGALDYGICPIRHELYRECFNELIRQMAVSCAERGLLLARIRDELDNTIAACLDVYISATAFGLRVKLLADTLHAARLEKCNEIFKKRDELIKEQQLLRTKLDDLERQGMEEGDSGDKKYAKDHQGLTKINQQLKSKLAAVIAPKPATSNQPPTGLILKPRRTL